MISYDDDQRTRPVADAYRFDVAALERYLRASIEGFVGPLVVEQFNGGQSDPTFKRSVGNRRYVLRRKPSGTLLPSAHTIDQTRLLTLKAAYRMDTVGNKAARAELR